MAALIGTSLRHATPPRPSAVVIAVLLSSLCAAAPSKPKDEIFLKIHANIASIWVTVDPAKGTLSLREELPEDARRRPRKMNKRVDKKRARALLLEADANGFYELDERYVEPGEGKPAYRLELTSGGEKRSVSVFGTPPEPFQALVDGVEALYGQALMPGVALPKRRLATPEEPTRGSRPAEAPRGRPSPDDPRSKEWED